LTRFKYQAKDRYGVQASGFLEGETSKGIALQLEKLGYTPLAITSLAESSGAYTRVDDWFASFQKVGPEELIVFSRQLASILEAGVPLLDGLEAVQDQVRNKKFRIVVRQVKRDIEGGSTFSDALEKHINVFSALFVNMVRAGERAGILGEVLDRLSNLMEKDFETVNKIKTATRYPLIVVVTMVFAFIALTTFVIPRFASFFGAYQTELPLPTRIMMGMNYVFANYWYWILGVVFIGAYMFKKTLDTKTGRYAWDRFILSTPIFGPLFNKIYLSRFSRMLAAMLRSGIPILDALLISSATAENKVVARVVMDVRAEVAKGKSLAEPMKGSQVFPPIAVSMVAIGEKAGTLEQMLNRVSDYFDREADYTIDNLTPLLEPILIFCLGMVLLLFALGIFLPMWNIVKVYKTY